MKGKKFITLGWDENYSLLGISCHLKEYRFCWLLNQSLELDLRRVGDFFPVYDVTKQSQYAFPFFYFGENARDESFFLLGNHSPEGDLLDRYTHVDYLLFIHELAYPSGMKGLVQEVRKIKQVLTAFEIIIDEIKDGHNLISGIELSLLEYEKEQKEQKENPEIILK